MDIARSTAAEADAAADYPATEEPRMERPPAIGTDERRMHVRAYNFWVSLLHGRPYPSVDSFDPARLPDFGPHGVLLDFRGGAADPAIAYLGTALRAESGVSGTIERISDVPGRSLLSRLTDHYLQILANRSPIGFEAEFVNARGNNTLYRGILMPFSSNGATIDFVYGVINWKELADPGTTTILSLEIDGSLRKPPPAPPAPSPAPAANALWADGPGRPLATAQIAPSAWSRAAQDDPLAHAVEPAGASDLADYLAAARNTVDMLRSADVRSRGALYRALGLAYDFSCTAARHPEQYAELLADAGVRAQKRAPMTGVAKLVFGADYDKTRLTEFAAVLAHGHRVGLKVGALRPLLERKEGGLKAVVAEEREAKRAAPRPDPAEAARTALRAAPAQALIEFAADAGGAGEFVLLLARRQDKGKLAVLAAVPEEAALVDRAIRRVGR